jgi:hypothetical protein
MKLLPVFAIILFLLCSGIAQAGDENSINQQLSQSSVVHLASGVYNIEGPIYIHSGNVLSGDPGTILRVDPNSGQWYKGRIGIINNVDDNLHDVSIYGLSIDGNIENLPSSYSSYDSDPHDAERAIYIQCASNAYGSNISVHDMRIYDTFSDAIHIAFANNVNCYNNFCSDCQHDSVFFVDVIDGNIYNNQVAGITDGCSRLDNCQHIKVFNNTFYSYTGDNNNGAYEKGNVGIQAGNEGVSFGVGSPKPDNTENIEICNNIFADIELQAVLLDDAESNEIYVHDNKFVNVAPVTTNGEPVSYTNIPNVNMSEKVFGSIFDILNTTFSDSGRTDQTADEIPMQVKQTENGIVVGGIKIVGFKDKIIWNNETYIPDNQSVLVKPEAIKSSSLNFFSFGVDRMDKNVSVSIDNGTATATMTVTAYYYSTYRNKLGILNKGALQKSVVTFTDSCPSPKVLERPVNITGMIYQYPTFFYVSVPSNGLVKVHYDYMGNSTDHSYAVGEMQTDDEGVQYTQFTKINDWVGNIPNYGEYLYVNGTADPQKLTVTAYTPYEHFEVKNFNYVNYKIHPQFFADWFWPSIGMCIIVLYGIRHYYNNLFN